MCYYYSCTNAKTEALRVKQFFQDYTGNDKL